jgi:MFS family permease
LLSWASWGSIFWVNVPVGVLGFAAALVGVTESKDPRHRRLDVVGASLCMIGLFGLTLGLLQSSSSGWGSPLVEVSSIGGLAVLGCFVVWEHWAPQPMAPPELLQERSFRWSCIAYLLAYATFTGVLFYVTLLFQDVKGWSALWTGLSWLVLNAPFLLVAQAAGALHRRFSGRAVMTIGLLLAALGVFALSQVTTTTTFVLAAVGYGLLGLGFGMFAPAVSNAAMAHVPTGNSGIASGILNASRQVGTSVGLAVLGTIGTAVSISSWTGHLTGLPSSKQALSHSVKQSVAGGQIHQLGDRLGSHWIAPATSSFLHGYEIALAVGAALLVVAAAGTFFGLTGDAAQQGEALAVASAPSARATLGPTRQPGG